MIYKLKGLENNTSVEVEKADELIKLQVGKETVNLAYTQVCELSKVLNDAKNSIFEDAVLDLGV